MKKNILLGLVTALAITGQSVAVTAPVDSVFWPKANTSKKQHQKSGKREYKNRHKKGRP